MVVMEFDGLGGFQHWLRLNAQRLNLREEEVGCIRVVVEKILPGKRAMYKRKCGCGEWFVPRNGLQNRCVFCKGLVEPNRDKR